MAGGGGWSPRTAAGRPRAGTGGPARRPEESRGPAAGRRTRLCTAERRAAPRGGWETGRRAAAARPGRRDPGPPARGACSARAAVPPRRGRARRRRGRQRAPRTLPAAGARRPARAATGLGAGRGRENQALELAAGSVAGTRRRLGGRALLPSCRDGDRWTRAATAPGSRRLRPPPSSAKASARPPTAATMAGLARPRSVATGRRGRRPAGRAL